MKQNKKHIVIFFLLYLTILILFALSDSKIHITIDTIYTNVFLFALYLFFSQFLLFDCEDTSNIDIKTLWKRSIHINFNLVFTLFLTNFTIINIFVPKPQLNGILLMTVELFLILTILSFFSIIFDHKNKDARMLFLIFAFLLYGFQNMYGDNLFFINLYQYYFKGTSNITVFIHYLIWILIPIIIIYYQGKKKEVEQ